MIEVYTEYFHHRPVMTGDKDMTIYHYIYYKRFKITIMKGSYRYFSDTCWRCNGVLIDIFDNPDLDVVINHCLELANNKK